MKISHSWLNEFITLTSPVDEIAEVLTQVGLEVEGVEHVEKVPGGLKGLVVGEVLTCEQHPNADKLKKTTVDIGLDQPVSIICGAPNVAVGQKVVIAPVNTTIHPTSGEPFKIKKSKIRGELSEGMICAEDEIGLGANHDGILVLETSKPNGTPAKEIFDLEDDIVYEIGLTPNRGDAASHFGTARDLGAYFEEEINFPKATSLPIVTDNPISVRVENHAACPRYSGVTIRGVKVTQSPAWLQTRLKTIGLAPINSIVDITNYVLHGLGQPLHAFDADKIKGGEVIVKTMPEGTPFVTLDEKERKLSDKDLMICDAEEGMCIAGVFGGVHSGITTDTTSVFLESAYFSPDWVRATSLRYGLTTDASFRYERGADPEMTMKALQYAASLIVEISGGSIASDWIDIYPTPIPQKVIGMKYDHFDWLIGKDLPREEIKRILNALDIDVEETNSEEILATVPTYRSEVTRPADLVEEVLRIHGINNVAIDDVFATDYLAEFQENEPYIIQERISHFLAGRGFHEILTNSLTNPQYHSALNLGGTPVEILNKSSEELGILKTTPLYTSLEVLRHNINRRQPNLKVFEFSKTYHRTDTEFHEHEVLTLLATGSEEETWQQGAQPYGFHTLVGAVHGLFQHLNIAGLQKEKIVDQDVFSSGLRWSLNGTEIGSIGLLKKKITSHFEISQDVVYAALDWPKILGKTSQKTVYKAIPKFPEVRRDLSLVVDKSVSFGEIEAIAFKSEKKLLNRVNLFSIYEGDRIDEGKKSYALSFHLQDHQKTLNDKQIDRVMDHLIRQFEENLGAIIRR